MARTKETPPPVTTSPAEQLVELLGQVDDAALEVQIAAIDVQIEELIGPLKKKRDALNRCRTILRGRKMSANGQLKRRKKAAEGNGDAAVVSEDLKHGPLLDRIARRLKFMPGSSRAIAEDVGATKEDVHGMLTAHRDLFASGVGGVWALLSPEP